MYFCFVFFTQGDCEVTFKAHAPILKSILDTKQPVDTIIVCSDGRLGVHRLVLAAVSQFLNLLFGDDQVSSIFVCLYSNVLYYFWL